MKSIHLNIPSHKLIVGNNTVCLLLYVLKQNVYIVITSPDGVCCWIIDQKEVEKKRRMTVKQK